jgi:hypothetical protein
MNRWVTGFHGCHAYAANKITSGTSYDWLGQGIYFWEDGPNRAAEWAHKKFGESGVVLKAKIDLGHCLNLLDTAHFDRMEQSYLGIARTFGDLGLPLLVNARKRHPLDYLVVETYCNDAIASDLAFDTVRGCFPEGKPLYHGSKILRETHIQVAVRDSACISDLAVVN